MIANPDSMSLKQRAEAQIIAEIITDPEIMAIIPKKQNEESKLKFPYISVTASVGREVSPGANLFNITVSIEVNFKHPADNVSALDVIVQKIKDRLSIAQGRGEYGIILDGEQATQFVTDTIRRRPVQVRLIAG